MLGFGSSAKGLDQVKLVEKYRDTYVDMFRRMRSHPDSSLPNIFKTFEVPKEQHKSIEEFMSKTDKAKWNIDEYKKSLADGTSTTATFESKMLSIGNSLKNVGKTVATIGLNIGAYYFIEKGIEFAIKKYDELANASVHAIEAADKASEKVKSNHQAVNESKQWKTDNGERFLELQKGVDATGHNVSLTNSEFSEYLSLASGIATTIPSLVKGYNDLGQPLLTVTDSMKGLNDAFRKADTQKYQENIKETGTLLKGLREETDHHKSVLPFSKDKVGTKQQKTIFKDLLDAVEEKGNAEEGVKSIFDKASVAANGYNTLDLESALKQAGIKWGWLSDKAAVAAKNIDKIRDANQELAQTDTEYAQKVAEVLPDYLNLNDDYYNLISDKKNKNIDSFMQSVIGSFSSDTILKNLGSEKDIKKWSNSVVSGLKDSNVQDSINELFELNGKKSKMSFKDYESQVDSLTKSIASKVDGISQKQIKNGLGLTDTIESLNKTYNAISDRFGKDITKNMSIDDLQLADDIISTQSISNAEQLASALSKARKELEAMTSFDTLVSKSNGWMKAIDNINAALVNSVSGKGLGFEIDEETGELTGDITNMQSAFKGLDGYDLLLEKTANGIHINRDALRALQAQETSNNKQEYINTRLKLQEQLNDKLAEQAQIEAGYGKNSDEYNAIQASVNSLQNQLETVDLLASAYDGATSAYQKWINAQSAGEEGDMYDTIRDTALDRGKELYDKGLVGTEEFRAIADLFSYEDLSTAPVEQVVAAYENAAPSIKKFFTDGREGVDGFVESMKSISDANNMGWVDVLEDGSYKFNTGDDDAIARELGIDVEAVQAIYKKLKDYGAEGIQIGDTSGVENYSDRLKELEANAESAKEKLNEMAGTDLKFNFDSQSIDNLSSQIDQANQIVQNLPKNEDGTINVHTDGAQESITVLQTLIQKREELASSQNIIMRVNAEENEPVNTLQNFQHAKDELDTLNQLNAQGIQIDTSEAQGNVDDLMESVQKIADEHPELELDTSSADALEESLSHLTEDQLLALGIDTSQLDSAKEKLDAIKGMNEFNVSVNVNGKSDVDALGNELSSLPPNTPANISVNVQDSSQLDNTVQQLEKVPPDTTANFTFSVQNADEAETLSSKIAELNGERDGDHQITYTMNIVPGDNSAESQIETLTQPKEANIAVNVTGQEQIMFLQGQLSALEDKTINISANTTGFESLPLVQGFINRVNDKNVGITADVSGTQEVNSLVSAISRVIPKLVNVTANVSGTGAVNALANAISGVHSKMVTITTNNVTNNISNNIKGKAWGTLLSSAHSNGTAYNVINTTPSHATGKVALDKDETALVNEMGTEGLIRDGRLILIPGGMHFQSLKKGDIILSVSQMKSLFTTGKASGHGKAYADGTVGNVRSLAATSLSNAYSAGSSYKPGKNIGGSGSKAYSSSKSESSNSSSTPQNTAAVDRNTDSTDENTKSNKSLQDWIEQLVSVQKAENGRLYDAIEDFEMNANQNKAIDTYVGDSESYMDTLRQAQNRYMTKANALGVPGNYVHKIWAGELDIEDIQDEDLKEKISQYQTWYEKAKDLGDEIVDINRKIRETKIKKLDNIKDDYENLVSLSESMADYNESISDLSEKLNLVGDSKALKKSMDMQAAMREALVNEQKQLTTQLNALVADGTIAKNTDTWNKWQEEINKVKKSIVDCDSALADLKKNIMEIRYSKFEQSLDNLDFTGDMASSVRDLMNKEGIYDDDVQLTSTGYAQLALMSTELTSAKQKTVNYQAAINALKKDLKNGNITQAQYNEKLQEYQKGQMDAAKSTKSAKDAILDLVKNGIEKQTEAMEKLINKRKEELQKMKEADDYQKNMADRSKEINAIKAQIAALEGNDSKEAIAQKKNLNSQLQKLQDEYDETRKDHEYDVISQGYDSQLAKFKENQEAVTKELESSTEAQQKAISEVLEATKNQQAVVYEELKAIAGDYQMSLTDSLTKPWSDAQAALKQFQDSMGRLNANVSIDTSKIKPTKPSKDKTTPTKNESNKQTVDKSKTGTWLKQDGRWWYQHSDGTYTKNAWEAIDGQWYKFDEQGWMQTGWQPWGVDKNGQALWYYMTDSGNMAASTWIDDKYYVDHTGAMARNGYIKSKDSGLYYWVNGDGVWEPQWNTYTPDLKKYKLYYESGTSKAKDGLAFMDDKDHKLKLGSEAIITQNGVLGNFGGSAIFNERQTEFLHKFSDNPSYIPNVYTPKLPDYSNYEVKGGGNTYNVHYDNLLNVEGNVTKDVFPGMKKMCEESFKYSMHELRKGYDKLR